MASWTGPLCLALSAATPVASQAPLAPGEISVELNEIGTAHPAANLATFVVAVRSGGETPAAALTENRAAVARMSEAAREAGVAAGDVRTLSPPSTDTPGNPELSELVKLRNDFAVARGRPTEYHATAVLQLGLHDLRRVPDVPRILRAAGAFDVSGPLYGLVDIGPARGTARADAIRRAREEAEATAAASGMRVVRIVRVIDRADLNMAAPMAGGEAQSVPTGPAPLVEVRVAVSVDFLFAPQ